MNDKPPPSRHFEIMVPTGSEPVIESNTPELLQIIVPSGGVVSGTVNGQHFCLKGANLELTLESVNAVTVADLTWVEQHTITRVFDSVSHFIRFIGGGELRFAFSFAGDLLELSAERVGMKITPDGETLIFWPLLESLAPTSTS